MKIGIRTGHLYGGFGGGYQAVKWHILALQALGHSVAVHTTNAVGKWFLENWFDGVPLRYYLPGVEKEYDFFVDINHFDNALPGAKQMDIKHVFFPQKGVPAPAESIRLYSNSAYTARHIQTEWNREAVPLYIPIDNYFKPANKQNIILHVSRFSEPSDWADKSHRQMIQAFKMISRRLPGWRLIMVGSVDPGQEFYLDELARLGQRYEIDLMPGVSNEKLAEIYGTASIYWHATGVSLPTIPSAQEHMGISPIEAQASGCVPICYNSGGIPEVVLNGRTGLLFDNIQDLPAMTVGLIENLGKWAQLSQAGQIWGAQRADFGAFVKRIDDMLDDRPITPIPDFRLELKHGPSEVTAVIPTMNSPLLEKCLSSLKKTAPAMRVIVMNNGSPLSFETDSTVQVVDLGENFGFAGALKKARPLIQTPFTLLLNDDIEANRENWLEYLLLPFNREDMGVTGPRLLFPDGRLQFAGGMVDWSREDIGYHRNYGGVDGVDYSTPREVGFITGAALLCKTELFEMPSELDGTINFEDTWMCFAASEKGYKVVYQPASVMVHTEGETKKRTPDIQDKVNRAKKIFVERWRK